MQKIIVKLYLLAFHKLFTVIFINGLVPIFFIHPSFRIKIRNINKSYMIILFPWLLLSVPLHATTIHVPADYTTIQSAIEAALPNDTVMVEPGTYTGSGNRDIDFHGKSIVVKSTGGPSVTIIDCQGSSTENHRGFIFQSSETSASHLEGFFITNGYASNGAAIYCDQTSPTIVNCIIRSNSGDGIYSFAGSPVISGCRIEHCSGPGFRGQFASPTIQNTEFHFNSIQLQSLERATITGCVLSHSGSLLLYNESQYRQPFVNIGYCTFADNSGYGIISDGCITQIYRSIIAFNTGQSIYCGVGSVNISESDVFGNSGGDWVGCIADQKYQGNLEVDPLFCNRATADYHLLENSPCNGMGALSVGCISRLWHIYADGSGDVPTIQEAVNASAPGDTILLHHGTYTGAGNRDIELTGKYIILKGMSGADNTIIDCQGNQNDNHRALNIHDVVSDQCIIEGITFQNGYLKSGLSWEGGASIICRNASPIIRNCLFRNNTLEGAIEEGGGAIFLGNSTTSVSFCVFEKNVAPHSLGGSITAQNSSPNIENCTFVGSIATFGDAIGLWGNTNASIKKCIFAYNGNENWYSEPGTIFCMNSPTPTLSCCNIYGNANGDWIGCIASQVNEAGNMSENPLFCDMANHDYHLMDLSICTPARNTCQELIGCLPVDCQAPVPEIINPGLNADILTTQSILFQWSQVSWAESYSIEIALDPTTSNQAIEDRPAGTFTTPLAVIDAGNADQWLAEAGYLSIGKYYWHVLARYGAASGTFSSTSTFTVKWPLSVSNWTVFCKDSLRTAATVEEVSPPYRMTWGGTPIATGSPVRAPAVVSGDTLFFADCGGKVWALNVETGSIFWSVSLSSTVQFWASPLYQDGRLYVTGTYPEQSSGIVYCLNARNGSTIWTRNFNGGSLMNAPSLVAGQLLVYENQTTHVLDAGDGIYIRAFAGGLWSPAAVWRNKAYFNYSQLYEYDPSTGQVTALLETGQSSPVAISPDGHIYFNNHSMLSSFNLQTQQLEWTSNQNYTGGVLPRQLAVGENLVIVPSGSAIYAVNRETGQYVWTAYGSQGGTMDTQSPIIAGNSVLFTKGYGCLYAVDLTTGSELTYYQPATTYCYSSPIVSHGRIFYGLDNGNFYGLETGQETRATLTVFCFNDANGDGLKGAYEQPLPNLTVQLSNGMIGTTGPGGLCGFTVDAPVIYTVTVSTPSGYVYTTPNPATIRAEIGGYNQVFMGFQTKPTLTISPATFGPLTKENPTVTFTVQLTGKGTPLVGRQVEILSYIAPTGTPGLMTTVTTDANGQGTYTWSIEHLMESPSYNVNFIARFNGDSEWGPAVDTSLGSVAQILFTVTLDDPAEGTTITLPYTFHWHGSHETGPVNYTLEISNSSDFAFTYYTSTFTSSATSVTHDVSAGPLSAPGVYYWRVTADRTDRDPVVTPPRSFTFLPGAPDITLLTPFLDFGVVPGGDTRTATVTIRNDGTGTLNYTVQINSPVFSTAFGGGLISANSVGTIDISCMPTSGDFIQGQLILGTDDPDEPVVIVHLFANAGSKKPTYLTLEPLTVNCQTGDYVAFHGTLQDVYGQKLALAPIDISWQYPPATGIPAGSDQMSTDYYGNLEYEWLSIWYPLTQSQLVMLNASYGGNGTHWSTTANAQITVTPITAILHATLFRDMNANGTYEAATDELILNRPLKVTSPITGYTQTLSSTTGIYVIEVPKAEYECTVTVWDDGSEKTLAENITLNDFNADNVATLSFGLVPANLELAMSFAPILCIDPRDQWSLPTTINYLLSDAFAGLYSTEFGSVLDQPVTEEVLREFSMSETYIEPGSTYLHWTFQTIPITNPNVYARVVEEGGYKVIQYWFYYPYNSYHLDPHEGDWEMVEVVIDPSTRQPLWAAFAQHNSKVREPWSGEVEILAGTNHPVVYVASGSHASYFHAGEHLLEPHHLGNEALTGLADGSRQSLNFVSDALLHLGLSTAIVAGVKLVVIPVAQAVINLAVPLIVKTIESWLTNPVSTAIISVVKRLIIDYIVKPILDCIIQYVKPYLPQHVDIQQELANVQVGWHAFNENLVDRLFTLHQADQTVVPSAQTLMAPAFVIAPSISRRYSLTYLTENAAFAYFNGHWGQVVKIPGTSFVWPYHSGPLGPKYSDLALSDQGADRWNHPITWANHSGSGPVIEIALACPASLSVFDSLGRITGKIFDADSAITEIPYSLFLEEDAIPAIPQTVVLSAVRGRYTVRVAGTGIGEITLNIRTYLEGQLIDSISRMEAVDSNRILIAQLDFNCTNDSCLFTAPIQLIESTDSLCPVIYLLSELDFGVCDDTLPLVFSAVDDGMGIDRSSVSVYLDDIGLTLIWDTISNQFTVPIPCIPDSQLHQLNIQASDIPGNRLEWQLAFHTGPYASVSGTVNDEVLAALVGLSVDIYDANGNLWQTVVTDDSGYYYIDSIPNGDYTISVVTPLGYQADQETKEFTIHHVPVIIDFTLTPLEIMPKPRTRAYWAHQLHKVLQNKPLDYTMVQFAQFAGLINQHFNQNLLNPVDFYTVPQPATQQDSLNVLRQLLHMVPCGDNEPFLKKLGKAQLIALMLNVVSGKIHQMQAISKDSLTVSQAITYCDMLVNDEITPDDDGGPGSGSPWIRYIRADFILTFINLGLKVPAGLIPPDIINIAYRYHEQAEPTVPETFTLYQNYPNPFNPVTEISFDLPHTGDVKLEIFNIMGQKVTTLIDQGMGAGHHTTIWDASNQASGIYFYRITTGDINETKKMILLK